MKVVKSSFDEVSLPDVRVYYFGMNMDNFSELLEGKGLQGHLLSAPESRGYDNDFDALIVRAWHLKRGNKGLSKGEGLHSSDQRTVILCGNDFDSSNEHQQAVDIVDDATEHKIPILYVETDKGKDDELYGMKFMREEARRNLCPDGYKLYARVEDLYQGVVGVVHIDDDQEALFAAVTEAANIDLSHQQFIHPRQREIPTKTVPIPPKPTAGPRRLDQ